MLLSEILSNPLFIPLLVAFLTIISTAYFNYWLSKWQYKREYIISNVEKTYIPLVAEIRDNIDSFNKFFESPFNLIFNFEKMENIKRQGLFEFIRNHDRKLGDKLSFFYESIYPRFEKFVDLQQETRHQILEIWVGHIRSLIPDQEAKKKTKTFVDYLYNDGLYLMLLKGELSKSSAIWDSRVFKIVEEFNLYTNYVQVKKDEVYVSRNAKIPTFTPPSEELKKLEELSQPNVKNLLDYYKQTKEMVDIEVINGLIPMMQKYITDPLARKKWLS